MTPPLPQPSSRLVRAVAAEREDVLRARERIAAERETLRAELQRLESLLAEAEERLEVLRRLAPDAAEQEPETDVGSERNHQDESRELLRGPAIRRVAVEVLAAQSPAIEAMHYKDWYALLLAAGYGVAGKNPTAVFLTQLSRSPVVRKTTSAGVYELDREAPARLRERLEKLQAELRDVAAPAGAPADLAKVRARRRELDVEITQVERALEEAVAVLDGEAAAVASAG